jgi:soluble lytic murein transglycosylase
MVPGRLAAEPRGQAAPDAPASEAAPGAGAISSHDEINLQFIAAMQRVRSNLPEPPDSPALQAYAIYDYLVAARLRRNLALTPGDQMDQTIDEFLNAHAGQPVGRSLKRQWLASLADRNRWDWFLPRSADSTDPTLICDSLQGKLATGATAGLAAEALARWSLPQKQPSACEPVFGWLRQQGLLTPGLAESRTRAALAADNPRLAREFAADVPAAAAAPLRQWADLLEAPAPLLESLAGNPAMAVEPEALVAGFTHFAHTDHTAALDLLPRLLSRPDLTPALRGRLQRAAALSAAYNRDPAAVAAFAGLAAEAVDDQVQEWRVRAALWNGEYAKALDWLDQMPTTLATQPRWRYWRARAIAATSGRAAAAPLFAEIAGLRDYYGYLAADQLGQSYQLNARRDADDADVQNALAAEPGLTRARELFECGLIDDAEAEWAGIVAAAAPAVKVQAAHLARRWGWYAESIATLARTGDFDDVRFRYPRPYAEAVGVAVELSHVPADWILAVMRQESLFRTDAVSRADARGLMQMLPVTATAVARRWRLPSPRPAALFDPLVAVPLGAAYLRELLDHYGGQLALCLAAYNAGTAPVARWLPSRPLDADIWVENIPYNETRSYVQHIFEHIVAFAWVRDAELPHLETLMPPVLPAHQ